ncbi:nicotinate-nucleotide--dimethylbenzimidazole phosphoribosyltransferase [Syntrophotalea carbinolica DSM 2380]|uniref:Nicotinate-nucleotide--dimethylbenzimidazole phosphoribosyltransferase n=1 Tax=Syntrophotalea carbinolica (strain DSM 2380 / NBRC 103641 / GraBd1) TaxID=338963 RepID=COBT_SYNC1|nr:nicotinate-nucleotide--dimethylbenzimidazole phosphoribosyltransferase [Syntrophotalea carbinolica]Q3A798.1 RecName: Full=Nicotinate-nucleotide--dimethylbenzimidazole phosphoribosyltransferase; Short=NN:DBI PRT; AltName: Full=N(1)-alpha-phosphoribosyltransferase [Syntrophotalea carbinolica DSM 2380]ABA87746.1 nicotinate-nucleotide--dimethylbenzimidazole phosphoribosyltransferase [Syntrophotalea carbinolica DSM 2380]
MNLLHTTVARIKPQDENIRRQAKDRLDRLTMPHWALGRLLDLALDLAGMTGSLQPPVDRRLIVTMAGDHGVAAEGVSAFPQEVTGQMVANIANGGAGISTLARVANARVQVVDMGAACDLSDLVDSGQILSRRIAPGTANMALGAAMTREQAVRSLEAGIEIANTFAGEADLFGTGEMGIANTTPSSAIVALLADATADQATGCGTGIDDNRRKHKVSVIERALQTNLPDPHDGLDVLAKVGGFEIGGLAGLILGAAALRKPIIIDGFISTAAALLAQSLAPASVDYMIAAHHSIEQGHQLALARLGKKPLLDLDFRLGEGTGAALAMNLVEGAKRLLTEMATFDEAAVSQGK